jgi:hypothetical protein
MDIVLLYLYYFLYMSSVEGSDKGEDSLSDELELVLKNNKIQRNKHNSRGLRNANTEDSLYK